MVRFGSFRVWLPICGFGLKWVGPRADRSGTVGSLGGGFPPVFTVAGGLPISGVSRLGIQDPTADWPPILVSDSWAAGALQPTKGAGWWGKGLPIRATHGHQKRDLEDGAGICSPGRWSPKRRRLPDTDNLSSSLVEAMKLDAETWDGLIWKMLAGRMEADPFTSQQKADGAAALLKWTSEKGFPFDAFGRRPGSVDESPSVAVLPEGMPRPGCGSDGGAAGRPP